MQKRGEGSKETLSFFCWYERAQKPAIDVWKRGEWMLEMRSAGRRVSWSAAGGVLMVATTGAASQ